MGQPYNPRRSPIISFPAPQLDKDRQSPPLALRGEQLLHNAFGALLFNLCYSFTFQVFLETLAEENPRVAGRRAILLLYNA